MKSLEKLLMNKRSLRRVLNEMTLTSAESCLKKIQEIIEERRKFEEQLRKKINQKKLAISQLREQMTSLGISVDDLVMSPTQHSKKGKKVPVKYEWQDNDGNIHKWTGRGNMPRSLKDKIEKDGKSLESFLV